MKWEHLLIYMSQSIVNSSSCSGTANHKKLFFLLHCAAAAESSPSQNAGLSDQPVSTCARGLDDDVSNWIQKIVLLQSFGNCIFIICYQK